MLLTSLAKVTVLSCTLLTLAACGGGGGTSSHASSSAASSSSSAVSSSSVSSSSSSLASCAYGGSAPVVGAAEVRMEAEDYDTCDASFSDTTPANDGGAYRDQSVDVGADTGASQGYFVQSMVSDEFTEYSVEVSRSGTYQLVYRARSTGDQEARLGLSVGGQPIEGSAVAIMGSAQWSDYATTLYLTDGAQALRLEVMAPGAELDYLSLSYMENGAISPQAAVAAMGIGINMGNTLDAPREGDWALPAQAHYFKDYEKAGFDHVRVPITWDAHTAKTSPYAVDGEFMDRVEQVVDWALAQGYYVIINAHHEAWLKQQYAEAANRVRFDVIWTQISRRFQNKSPRLLFEILNEPEGMTTAQVNELNARVLDIIRASNPQRLVVFSGNGFTSVDRLLEAAVPDDDYLIGNFHSYDPWEFAGQCTRSWGSQADIDALADIYQRAHHWSQENNVPVMVNEFGAAHYDYLQPDNVCDQTSRLAYLQAHVNLASEKGFAATVWDDGGSFVIYHRADGSWEAEKDTLVSPNP
jgi:endoglucanase